MEFQDGATQNFFLNDPIVQPARTRSLPGGYFLPAFPPAGARLPPGTLEGSLYIAERGLGFDRRRWLPFRFGFPAGSLWRRLGRRLRRRLPVLELNQQAPVHLLQVDEGAVVRVSMVR
jgi:hypothetical protein